MMHPVVDNPAYLSERSITIANSRTGSTVAAMRNRAGLETRRRILDATRRLLSERGVDGVTVQAICDAASIQPGSFYHQFDTKDEAVLAVVTEAIAALDERTDPDTDTPKSLVEAYVGFVEHNPDLARVYVTLVVARGITDTDTGRRAVSHHRSRLARLREAIARWTGQPEPDRQAERILAALNGYTIQALLDPDFDLATHANDLLEREFGDDLDS